MTTGNFSIPASVGQSKSVNSGPPGKGGDFTFRPGKGGMSPEAVRHDGSLIFLDADGNELIRMNKDGFFVEGRKVTSDSLVYHRFVLFVAAACIWTQLPQPNSRPATISGAPLSEDPVPFRSYMPDADDEDV